MKKIALLATWCWVLIASAFAAENRTVWVAQIRGTINPATDSYLKSAIQRAEKDQAEALVLELDTPGGLLSSVRDMVQAVDQSSVPVVIYVGPAGASATSAGALLMLSAHVAAMAPGTNIGAAHPVGSQGEDIKGVMGQKATNDTAAFARSLAEVRGRNREVAEEIVAKSKSFTAEEALKSHIIELVEPSREALFRDLEGRKVFLRSGSSNNPVPQERTIHVEGATVKLAEMTTGQEVLNFLANPNIAGLLMTLGVVLIYVEISAPGISLPGLLGGICLLVGFMTFQLLPIRAGGLLLLAAGIVMLLVEPFATAHGAFAAGGIIAFILGMIWVVDPSSTATTIGPMIWVPAALALGGMVLLIAFAATRMRWQSKRARMRMGGGGLAGLAGYNGVVESVSADGRSGKAHFRGELWSIVSETPLKPGDPVQVIRMDGMKAVVQNSRRL